MVYSAKLTWVFGSALSFGGKFFLCRNERFSFNFHFSNFFNAQGKVKMAENASQLNVFDENRPVALPSAQLR